MIIITIIISPIIIFIIIMIIIIIFCSINFTFSDLKNLIRKHQKISGGIFPKIMNI